MTSNELETRFTTLEALLLKLTEKKPSALQRFWQWSKPYIIPFILGMLLGGLIIGIGKQQAASGGAASPFSVLKPSSGSRLPMLSSMPPDNSRAEWSDSSWKSNSEPPLQANPVADNGQTTSTGSSRVPIRRMR